MTAYIKKFMTAMTILMIGHTVGWAGEPNDSIVSLEFQVCKALLGPLDASLALRSGDPGEKEFAAQKPAYAAGIPFEGPARYLARPGSGLMNDFLHFVLGETIGVPGAETHDELSKAQKEFLQATKGLLDAGRSRLYRGREIHGPIPQWYKSQYEPDSSEQLLLYAMTLEDAKAMAKAYTRFAMEQWRRPIDDHTSRIKQSEESIAAAQERTVELEKVIKGSEQGLHDIQKKVPYRTEEEGIEATAELNRMLNAALVDIAGIRARIEAIQKWQGELLEGGGTRQGQQKPQETESTKLKMMFIEESIALQGAEARKTMATKLRAEANSFLLLWDLLGKTRREKEQLRNKITKSKEEIDASRSSISVMMTDKPEIGDHFIAIYPVQWVDEGQGN